MLCVVVLASLPIGIGCKTSRAGQPPGGAGGDLVDTDKVPVELRDEWQALVDAQAEDRSAAAVDEAADALLEQEPPLDLRVGALQAKAERQYLLGNDGDAVALADEAVTLLGAQGAKKLREELLGALHRTLALALTRSGDPARALAELDTLDKWGAIERLELRGARAVAYDRQGERERALGAFVAWRELLADDSPDAGYAEERIRALIEGLDRATIERLAKAAPGPDAADCFLASLGQDPGDQAPDWVSECRPLPTRIGILLPRSGKLSALADAQFAAAVAAVTVLGRERPVSVMWRDSGSSAKTAREAAERIVADGAEVIIGPVGASNVRAAVAAAGRDRFLLPGEGSADARGVAPTLEQRAQRMAEFAVERGAPSLVVMIPKNGYGQRVRKALEKLQGSLGKPLKFLEYPGSTTSFAKLLRPVLGELQGGAAVVIGDALPRTELIARQLRREQLRVLGGSVDSEGQEVLVLSTGEGLAPDRISVKHASLDGVILAPVAAPDANSRAFEDQYRSQQGVEPDDQALLVWRALSAAWSGASGTHEPEAELVRVQGGRLVAVEAP